MNVQGQGAAAPSGRVGQAVLVLADGTIYRGLAYGATGQVVGDLAVCTAATGYQEILTDLARVGQIVVMTAPHIGNTGMNDVDGTSERIQASGIVVRDPARMVSNWQARLSLDDALVADGVVGVAGIDTRALVRHVGVVGTNSAGTGVAGTGGRAVRAGIFSGPALLMSDDAARTTADLLAAVRGPVSE
jgi:carbamoyl-phosphate synthase small subunit